MVACEELLQSDEVAKALTHLLTVDGYHVVVHPVFHHLVALRSHSLCYLTLMMWEYEVHTSTMNIEVVAKILSSHSSTFTMPSWETIAPRTWPTHDMLRLCLLPQSEVCLVLLLAYSLQSTALVNDILKATTREDTILMVFVVFLDIEIYTAIALIGISVVQDLLYQLLLLYDMTCGMRLYAWWQHVESIHSLMIAVSIILCYLHRFELLKACLLLYLVVALISIVLQVAYVGNVSNIAHLISQMLEITEQKVESDGRTSMSKMWIAIYGWTTNIHTYIWCMQWLKTLLATA